MLLVVENLQMKANLKAWNAFWIHIKKTGASSVQWVIMTGYADRKDLVIVAQASNDCFYS